MTEDPEALWLQRHTHLTRTDLAGLKRFGFRLQEVNETHVLVTPADGGAIAKLKLRPPRKKGMRPQTLRKAQAIYDQKREGMTWVKIAQSRHITERQTIRLAKQYAMKAKLPWPPG